MANLRTPSRLLIPLAALVLAGCATSGTFISQPSVKLTAVELSEVRLNGQTFLLQFEVANPNAFPLPVESVRYRILFDDQQFAGGETPASFSIPAGGTGEFSMSVNTDFLGSLTQVSSLLGGGIPDHVEYQLQGSLAIDLPMVRPVAFTNTGLIPVHKGDY